MKLYKKGGKLYYQKGGKMYLYQNGDYIKLNNNDSFASQYNNPYDNQQVFDTTEPSEPSESNKKTNVKSKIGQYANLANTAMSLLPKNEINYGGSEMGKNAFNSNQQTQNSLNSVWDGVNSAVPVWGAVANATRGLGNIIDQKDEYGISKSGVGSAVKSLIDPGSALNESIAIGKDYGVGHGIANQFTLGLYGKSLLEKNKKRVKDEEKFESDRNNMFDNYAKYGKNIQTSPLHSMNADYNAEVEDGEIIIGKDLNRLRHGGNSNASLVSSYALKLNGDKHGTDKDKDGHEGIPIKAEDGTYVASNHLGLNGKKAKNGKTVAKEMEPIVKSLSDAELNEDAYRSNPALVKHQLAQLESMKNEAESNKVAEELKKMLGKKDRNMEEIAQYIQENSEYLSPSNQIQQEQVQQFQTGGKVIGNIEQDLRNHAKNELGVNPNMLNTSQQMSQEEMNFDKSNQYNTNGTDYDVSAQVNDEEFITDDENVQVNETTNVTDSRQGKSMSETTMGEQAGTSKYTGTSRLIQEKMQEILDPNLFSSNGGLSEEWIQKGKSKGLSEQELRSATRKDITDGDVGAWLGKEMQEAFGVRSIGKDEQNRSVDPNVSGKSSNLYNNEKLNWAEDIRKEIVDNNGVVPSKYNDLPADLLDELTSLARSGKMASEGKFGTSLTNEFTKANESVATEIDREQALSYESNVDKGNKIDRNTDLSTNDKAGKISSFKDAFRYARNSEDLANEPYFTYKGQIYSKKTRSEDPELAAKSDQLGIKNKVTSNPVRNKEITPRKIVKQVSNPRSKLRQIPKNNSFQLGGNIQNSNKIQMKYPTIVNQNSNNNLRKLMQEGGQVPPGAESNAHMQQLLAQDPNIAQNPMQGQQDPNALPTNSMQQDPNMQTPDIINQLSPEVQQIFAQLPPEMQQQALQANPEEMEMVIQVLFQQMQQGGGQPSQPQMPPQPELI